MTGRKASAPDISVPDVDHAVTAPNDVAQHIGTFGHQDETRDQGARSPSHATNITVLHMRILRLSVQKTVRITAISFAFILGISSVHAADIINEQAPVAEDLAYNWTGFYIGAHGGIGGGTFNHAFNYTADPSREDWSYNDNEDITAFGAFGGAQIGYNHQLNPNWVVGVEADISASGIKAKDSLNFNWNNGEEIHSREVETKIDWFGTIRGRLGYAMDNFLIYGTGGAAYGSVNTSASENHLWDFGADGSSNSFSNSETKFGWTAGAGFEYGLTENITLKTEYLYVDLGSIDTSGFNAFKGDYGHTSVDTAFHALKTGLNYKF